MKESVAIAKEADAMFLPAKSDKSIHRVRNEPERQLGSLRSVIDSIRHDGGTPSVESIATELSSMHTAERASVLLALQRTHGNRYVQRVVAGIQAKLKIGQPGDVYEQEADRVAEEVMRMPEPQVQRHPEEEKKKKEIGILQTKQIVGMTPEVTTELESCIQALRSGGQLLPKSIRVFFEPRFGYDFSHVRVHADTGAADVTRTVNARAFTLGRDVVFAQGQYATDTTEGKRLMAHELTHVVQQGAAGKGVDGGAVGSGGINATGLAVEMIAREEPEEENAQGVTAVTDDTVYKVSDLNALLRTAPPGVASTGTKIPRDAQVKIAQRFTKDGKSYVFVKKAYGDKGDWGWTVEGNLAITDVPTEVRYGCNEATGYFIKNDKYLQQAIIDALGTIDNPIQIKNDKDEVVDKYYLRLTECMYPNSFGHDSRGHYTGHCVDIAFADSSGARKTYGEPGKSKIEEKGDTAFNAIYKHGDHFHGCVSYPPWVRARSKSQLKKLLRERKGEY